MAFFRNSTVNLLNLHYAIHAIALTGGGALFSAYLLKAGMSVPGTLTAFALILIGRLILRPSVVYLALRFGVRRLVIAGTILSALQYPFLAGVHGVNAALVGLIVTGAVGDTLYWSTYHAYFAALGDHEARGHQIGARESISAIVGIVSPLIASALLVSFGPRVAFGISGAIVLAAAVPLFWTPDVPVPASAAGVYRQAFQGILLFVGDGWAAVCYTIEWNLALFLTLGESFLSYGGALAIAAIVGAIGSLLLGRHIDAGHGLRALWLAFGTVAVIAVLRAFALNDPPLAVAANAAGALGGCLYIPTLMTAVYNMAKRSHCVLRFHVATEGGWDVGGASGLLISAALVHYGTPLWAVVLLSLVGLALNFVILRRYYTSHPGVEIDTAIKDPAGA
jgi:MFS family permease